MSDRLTDATLKRLKRAGDPHAARDRRILALLSEVVNTYPRERIHWLTDSREAIFNDWYAKRLHNGRLAAMIDKAGSVANLRSLARNDLQQYANEQRRGQLPTRLFKRLDKLLRTDTDRFTVMVAARDPGPTCWTLTGRPATAMFSERDHELKAHVWAVGLDTLEQEDDATNQTQFISHEELRRYAYEMLERSARGLTLDQLVRGLVMAYGLDPTIEELPDENALSDSFYASERAGIPMYDPPSVPVEDRSDAAQQFIDALSERQRSVLKRFLAGYTNQREIADALGCSPTTISNEMDTIRTAISELGTREEQLEILAATATLLCGEDGHEL